MPNQTKKHFYILRPFPVRKGEVCYDLWILQCDSPRADRESPPTQFSQWPVLHPWLCHSLLLPKMPVIRGIFPLTAPASLPTLKGQAL